MDAQTNNSGRIEAKFAELKDQQRSGLVTFVTAGDPDFETSFAIVEALPDAGADIIELGMPFSDPMADGPAIQESSQRALKSGQTMKKTLQIVRKFRETNRDTPIVLMGYYNPIYIYPVQSFLEEAEAAGVDGLIVVDLPPEADSELCLPAMEKNISFIRLATPTTDEKRLPTVLQNTSGFVYYVSIAGITGTKTPEYSNVKSQVELIKTQTDLPVAVGFGVNSPEQAREIARSADAVVVGSRLVNEIKDSLDDSGKAGSDTVSRVARLVQGLSEGVRS